MSEKPPESVRAKRVIVAEDESLIRIDIVETLRDHGFDVIAEAADGEKAVALAEELRPDLVVMDVKMPLMDGISAAEILTKKKIAPVVLLTAFSQRELVERASEAGALAYVVKSDVCHVDSILAIWRFHHRASRQRPRRGSTSRPLGCAGHRPSRDRRCRA